MPALPILALAFLGSDPRPPGTPPQGSERPDLVVILADDLGAETLGCYGGESYATPELDRLAREGVRLAQAFTQPLCTPTRVELLTGRSNARNYRAFSVLDPEERTFAHELSEAGYRTLAVGKWQLLAAEHYSKPVRGSGTRPEDAGFDHHTLWQVESLGGRHWGPKLTVDGTTRVFDDNVYGPDLALERALTWIDEGGDEPFLLFWPMILPHGPFLAPPGSEGPRRGKSDPELYGPMVEYMDTLVGRLVDQLRDRERARNTVVLFIGDNGSPNGIRSLCNGREVRGGKALPTHAGSHVPFLVWAPGRLEAGQVHTGLVSTVDVFATLLELAAVEQPDDRPFDGWSFWPALLDEPHAHREWVAFHHHARPTREGTTALRWARDERWQLFDDGRLFDVLEDPDLEHPLEGHAEVRGRLAAGLARLPSAASR